MSKKVLGIIVLVIVVIAIIIICYKIKKENSDNTMKANLNASNVKGEDMEITENERNVNIEVLTNTITEESVQILITDNNEKAYSWGQNFKIQKKINNNWEELKPIEKDLTFTELSYKLDKNNQLKMKVNYGKYYGKLEKGIYRIVKPSL